MAQPEGVSQWVGEVTRELPCLSPAQARVLAWWSYGMAYTLSCACHTVGPVPGAAAGAGLPRDPAVPARVVLRRGGHARAKPVSGGGGGVLRAAAGLRAAPLVGHAAGAGAGCDDPGLPLRGAHGERGVPWLRHPGGLEGARGPEAAGLAARVAGAAAHAAAGGAARLGGGGARRPRPLRRGPAHGCAVPSDRAAGTPSCASTAAAPSTRPSRARAAA